MTSPDSSDLAPDRTDAARCMEGGHLASWAPTDVLGRPAYDARLVPAAQRGEPRARGGWSFSATSSATGGVAGC
jgi:hypothetical protein